MNTLAAEGGSRQIDRIPLSSTLTCMPVLGWRLSLGVVYLDCVCWNHLPYLVKGACLAYMSAGDGGSACSGVEDEDTFRQWLSKFGGYVHPSLRLAESPSCQGRWVNVSNPHRRPQPWPTSCLNACHGRGDLPTGPGARPPDTSPCRPAHIYVALQSLISAILVCHCSSQPLLHGLESRVEVQLVASGAGLHART